MMSIAIRFYAELNDFLPPQRRGVTFRQPFTGHATIKDLIEALGVPHTEVDLILANGESVGFSYQVQDGDRISVYPVFEAIDVAPLIQVRPRPLREPRFVLDTHLGRLATYLRMFGFDTLYRNDYDDVTLARLSSGEHRILLTRDRNLLKRNAITHGAYIRATDTRQQLVEVLQRFDLFGLIAPLRRCLRCNDLLEAVARDQIIDRLPPRTRVTYDEFWICRSCGRIYWRGSHYQRMLAFIEQVTKMAARGYGWLHPAD